MSLLRFIPIIGSLVDPIGRIGELIAKTKLEQANAQTEQARIKSEERVRVLEAREQIVLRDPYGPIVRFAVVSPFIIYNAKLVLWDKVFEWGVTDPLSVELSALNVLVMGFYFMQVYRK